MTFKQTETLKKYNDCVQFEGRIESDCSTTEYTDTDATWTQVNNLGYKIYSTNGGSTDKEVQVSNSDGVLKVTEKLIDCEKTLYYKWTSSKSSIAEKYVSVKLQPFDFGLKWEADKTSVCSGEKITLSFTNTYKIPLTVKYGSTTIKDNFTDSTLTWTPQTIGKYTLTANHSYTSTCNHPQLSSIIVNVINYQLSIDGGGDICIENKETTSISFIITASGISNFTGESVDIVYTTNDSVSHNTTNIKLDTNGKATLTIPLPNNLVTKGDVIVTWHNKEASKNFSTYYYGLGITSIYHGGDDYESKIKVPTTCTISDNNKKATIIWNKTDDDDLIDETLKCNEAILDIFKYSFNKYNYNNVVKTNMTNVPADDIHSYLLNPLLGKIDWGYINLDEKNGDIVYGWYCWWGKDSNWMDIHIDKYNRSVHQLVIPYVLIDSYKYNNKAILDNSVTITCINNNA